MSERTVAEVESLYRRSLFERAAAEARQALDSFGEAISARTSAELHTWLGLASIELDDAETAATSLWIAHRWDPLDKHVGLALGRLLLRIGRDSEAWEVLEGVLLHHADDMKPAAVATVTAALVESYLAAGDGANALRRVEAALNVAPDDLRLSRLRISALELLGEEDALIVAQRVALDRPSGEEERVEALRELIGALVRSGRSREARDAARHEAGALDARLDAEPKALRRWEQQVALLMDAELWDDARAAHERMAARLNADDKANHSVLALIWRKVGDLCSRQLENTEAAAAAYATAERLGAGGSDEALFQPTGMHPSPTPLDELWQHVVQRPTDLVAAEDYGDALERAGKAGYAELVYRVVVAQGGGTPRIREHFGNQRWTPRRFARPLTDDLRNRYIRPRARRAALDALFHIAFHLTGRSFTHALRDHDLSPRDELSPNEGLPCVTVFLEVSADLGFTRPPQLYGNRRVQGVSSAFLGDPAFILGADVLGADDSPTLRFQAAQLLTMTQPRFFLSGLLTSSQLLAVAKAISGLDLPGSERCDPVYVNRIRETARASMTDAWESPLQDVTRRLREGSALPRIQEWSALVSAEAARTGLLVANDVDSALAMAGRFGVLREPERLDARRIDLALYAISPEFFELSEAVGLDVSA